MAFLGSRSFRSLWNSLIVSNAISGSFKIKFVERWRGKFYLNPVDRSAAVCCLLLDIGLIEFVNILVFWPSQCPARPAVQRSATIIIFIEMPRAPRPVSEEDDNYITLLTFPIIDGLVMDLQLPHERRGVLSQRIARLAIDGEKWKRKNTERNVKCVSVSGICFCPTSGTLDVGWFTPVD